MNKVVVGLVAGRHSIPVSEYIWESIPDVLDFQSLESRVESFLVERVGVSHCSTIALNQYDSTEVECFCGESELVVYVTGLTAATAAVIRACALNGVHLTLMHFDLQSGDYKAQKIF